MDSDGRDGGPAMSVNFLDHIKTVEDHRIPGMTTYPLDEVLLTVLVGLLCRMEDFDEIAMFGEGQLSWLRRFLPFRDGVAPAQTLRRVLRALDPKALERAFSAWVASLQAKVLRRGDRRQDPARDEAGQERRRCLACCFGLCA